MMSLSKLVERYRALAQNFGTTVPLADFGLSAQETERLFSLYDEDYHISRFFHFSEAGDESAVRFSVNGVGVTHVSIDVEIQTIL